MLRKGLILVIICCWGTFFVGQVGAAPDKTVLPPQEKNKTINREKLVLNKKEYDCLVKIVEAEAGGEGLEGKIAVASVVLNRVFHKDFPDTVTEVVFQKIGKVAQFSPVGDGRIHKVIPSQQSHAAVEIALKGVDPTSGAIFFYNPKTAKNRWIRSRTVIIEIGSHHFAY